MNHSAQGGKSIPTPKSRSYSHRRSPDTASHGGLWGRGRHEIRVLGGLKQGPVPENHVTESRGAGPHRGRGFFACTQRPCQASHRLQWQSSGLCSVLGDNGIQARLFQEQQNYWRWPRPVLSCYPRLPGQARSPALTLGHQAWTPDVTSRSMPANLEAPTHTHVPCLPLGPLQPGTAGAAVKGEAHQAGHRMSHFWAWRDPQGAWSPPAIQAMQR